MFSRWFIVLSVLLLLTACTQETPKATPNNPVSEEPQPQQPTPEQPTPEQPTPVLNAAQLGGKAQGYTGNDTRVIAGPNGDIFVETTLNPDGSFNVVLPTPAGNHLFPLKTQLESSFYLNPEFCGEVQLSDESVMAGVVEGLYVLDVYGRIMGMLVQVDSQATLDTGFNFINQDEFNANLIPTSGSGFLRVYVDKDVTGNFECNIAGYKISASATLKKGWNLLQLSASGKNFSLTSVSSDRGEWHFVADPGKIDPSVIEGKVEGYTAGQASLSVNAIGTEGNELEVGTGMIKADGSFRMELSNTIPRDYLWDMPIASPLCQAKDISISNPNVQVAILNSINVIQNNKYIGTLEQASEYSFSIGHLASVRIERLFATGNTQVIVNCNQESGTEQKTWHIKTGWNTIRNSHGIMSMFDGSTYTHFESSTELTKTYINFTPWQFNAQ